MKKSGLMVGALKKPWSGRALIGSLELELEMFVGYLGIGTKPESSEDK